MRVGAALEGNLISREGGNALRWGEAGAEAQMCECVLEVRELAGLQEIGGCRSLGTLKPLHLAEILGLL